MDGRDCGWVVGLGDRCAVGWRVARAQRARSKTNRMGRTLVSQIFENITTGCSHNRRRVASLRRHPVV